MTRLTRTLAVTWVALFVFSSPLHTQTRYEVTHTLTESLVGSLAQDVDGTLYGVTLSGGDESYGTVYRLTASGPVTVASFTADMRYPSEGGGLLRASDGAFYGTTEGGSAAYPDGTIYRVTPDGSLSVWAAFDSAENGATPSGHLTQGTDGYIYGTALFGPGDAPGVVYRVMPAWGATGEAGVIETYAMFPAGTAGDFGPAGESPSTGVTEVDGTFYGTAMFGGATGAGTIFSATPGLVSAVHAFDGSDGLTPTSRLLLGSDRNLYGTTLGDGFTNFGTLFRFSLDDSTLATLASFNGANGDFPYHQGVVESDGYLFGTTQYGGSWDWGTVYRWSPAAGLEVLHDMVDDQGDGSPVATLMKATDGALYGSGYRIDGGVIFRLVKEEVPSALEVIPATGSAGGSTDLVARLTANGEPIAHAVVTFSLNDVAVGSATTDANGIATVAGVSLAGIAPGTYPGAIATSFAGSDPVLPAAATGDLKVVDVTPPVLQLPADITANATSLLGRKVAYIVTATDAGGPVTVSCTPASGSLFPIGVTTVTCTATDAYQNVGIGTFTVTVLRKDLVAAYGFEEDLAGEIRDRSRRGNDGQFDPVNGPQRVERGRFGRAIRFDGIDDWITIPDSDSLDLTEAGFTLMAWVRPETYTGWRTAVLKETDDGLAYALYANEGNTHQCRPGGWVNVWGHDRFVVAKSCATPYEWVHIAATLQNGTIRIYVNGTLEKTAPARGNVATSDGPLRLGGNAVWGEYFKGTLDEIRLYRRSLSATEIADDMTTPVVDGTLAAPSPVDGLVAAYSFDDGTVADEAGHGHHGTIAGARPVSGKYGRGLSFDGVDDIVSIGNTPGLQLRNGMTLEAWVRPDALRRWSTVALKEAPSGLAYALYAGDSERNPAGVASIRGVDREVSSDSPLPTGAWSHIAVTYNGTWLKLWVDGVQRDSRSIKGWIQVSDGPLMIGGNNVWGEYFDGVIDNVRVYNRALGAEEVQTNMVTPID